MTTYSDSIRQGILDHLCESLRLGSTAGGYPFDVAQTSVGQDERNLLIVDSDSLPVFMVQPTSGGATAKGLYEYRPFGTMREHVQVTISARMDAPQGQSYDRKTRVGEKLFAYIEKGITDDFSRGAMDGITRGRRCVDTRVINKQMLQSVGADNVVVVMVTIECLVHRNYGQP